MFGYGSLLERWRQPEAEADEITPGPARLRGYRRTWNVAMDNTRTIPGYKYYVDRSNGDRPDWYVTFLNVVPDPAASVNGVVFPVSDSLLAELDRRERNYARVEVSAGLSPVVSGRAWVYTGSEAAVRRFEAGRLAGRAVICRDYYQRVLDDFSGLGAEAEEAFRQLTDPPPCPVVDLRRIDLAPDAGPGSSTIQGA